MASAEDTARVVERDFSKDIFGISSNGSVYAGYDNLILAKEDQFSPSFIKEEWKELAECMIKRWTAFLKGLE